MESLRMVMFCFAIIVGCCFFIYMLFDFFGTYLNLRKVKPKNNPINDDPNVNDLDFEAVEYLAGVIGDNVQTDYQLKVLARYELLKKEKSNDEELKHEYDYKHPVTLIDNKPKTYAEFISDKVKEQKNIIPEGFSIEEDVDNGIFYPKEGEDYLDGECGVIGNKWLGDKGWSYIDNPCKSRKEAIDVIFKVYDKKKVKEIKTRGRIKTFN